LAIQFIKSDLNIIALIGIILLIGIVKKNAILMIDFAVQVEREEGSSPVEAIYKACSVALPTHLNDHDGRASRRHAAGACSGVGSETAAAPGHHHCRRADSQPDADAFYDPGCLCLHGPFAILAAADFFARTCACAGPRALRLAVRQTSNYQFSFYTHELPINHPVRKTRTPPTITWKDACKNGVSM